MPLYEPDHIEYRINTGHIQIVLDDGSKLPAYWAHPLLGRKFPGVAVIHDWWGLTDIMRRLGNLFAQMGHYVIIPDLFDGRVARTPQQAIQLVEGLQDNGYDRVNDALSVLENHHQCNRTVAAVGVGMGGSLAFEAAIKRADLEAAVAYGGFPHRYFGQFQDAHAPIHAFYGEQEPHITPSVIDKLRKELASSKKGLDHHVTVIPGLAHNIFSDTLTDAQKHQSRIALKETFAFLDKHLESAIKHPRSVY